MRNPSLARPRLAPPILLAATLLAACSSGSDGQTTTPPVISDFAVSGTNVTAGEIWQLNRAIEIEFSEDVDFSTVSSATVVITDDQGAPAVGAFSLPGPRTVRFQPTCPTGGDQVEGGLAPARSYSIEIPDDSSGTGVVTVQNTAGEILQTGESTDFVTPDSTDPQVLFLDTVPGPPRIVIRDFGGTAADSTEVSYVAFPGRAAPDDLRYVSFDGAAQLGGIDGSVPINLYSNPSEQFTIVLRFDQAISAAAANIGRERIALEYLDEPTSTWVPLLTEVELLANCGEIGAEVELRPLGVVPQGAQLRVALRQGFQDLVGDTSTVQVDNLVRVASGLADPMSNRPDDGTDGILVDFTSPASVRGSLEDNETPGISARAHWGAGDGILEATANFPGTGGPGGDFDWIVPAGQSLNINTDADTIVGGPGGVPTSQQSIIGGVIQVRDFVVEPGARVIFLGSQTVTVLATGRVQIDGTVSVDGGDNGGVNTLNTTNQPEFGASGRAGGGDGGVGSFLTNESTERGGAGTGAFGVPGAGGQGGESGFAPSGICDRENRRGAGGGGGAFGHNVRYLFVDDFAICQTLVGMDGERGMVGSLDGTGAVSQNAPAQGGALGPRPFVDSDDENDFYGSMLTPDGRLVRGELNRVWAGAGGGAGGDAVRSSSFPLTPFSNTGDEKGCGGGGGAGGIEILAMGDVHVGPAGEISANGGNGNGGENVVFFDRVGGGSGGGSGGHIVISSARTITIEAEATASSVGDFYLDDPNVPEHQKRPISALGGQGGAGRESRCGAALDGPMAWRRDSIPQEAFEGNFNLPPQNDATWLVFCNQTATCATPYPQGETPGAGGDGSPGIIQLHVGDPATQLLFPNRMGVYGDLANPLDPTRSCNPPPLGWTRPDVAAGSALPFFSARSEALTSWIPLGLARRRPGGDANDPIQFLFGGIDAGTGDVLRDGLTAQDLPPLIDYTTVSQGGALPSIDTDTSTLSVAGSALPDIYRQNPSLLARFAMRIREAGDPDSETEYAVQSASYNDMLARFLIVVDSRGGTLGSELSLAASPEVELVPFFFRMTSGGVVDAIPEQAGVRIFFDAARADEPGGMPSTDPAQIFSSGNLSGFTPDPSLFQFATWDFVRMRFEFDIDLNDPDGDRPGMDWVRVLYSF